MIGWVFGVEDISSNGEVHVRMQYDVIFVAIEALAVWLLKSNQAKPKTKPPFILTKLAEFPFV